MNPYRHISGVEVDLTASPRANVISLKELCASFLVSPGVLTAAICHKLPKPFMNLLIQCAIAHHFKTSVTALLNVWPHEVYIFQTPLSIERWKVFVFKPVVFMRYKHLKKQYFMPLIIEHVIHSLVSDCENQCQIRCLDFSSYPVAGFLMRRVYGLIIEKCSMFPQRENGSPVKKEEQNSDSFIIKINTVVDDEKELGLLCETISHLKDNNTALNLQVTGIRLTALDISNKNILRLLDLIEPETLDAFSCCLNFSPEYIPHGFELVGKLRNFSNLVTLDFNLEAYNSGYSAQMFLELNDLFRQLKNLKNLTIYKIDSSRLIQISELNADQSFPSKLSLESFQLRGFTIPVDGLENFSLFPRALGLKSLSFTDCKLDLPSLVCLLTSCKNLLDLCLERCEFSSGNIDLLFQAFPAMKKLEYLNIEDMKMSSEDLLSKAEYVSCMPNLKYLTILPVLQEGTSCFDYQERFHHALEILWNSP